MAYASTPTISGVTGTVATGQTLTITGTDMVEQNTTGWDSMSSGTKWSFEGSSLTADGYTSTKPDVTYDATVSLFGNKSIKAHTDTVVGPHPSMAEDGAWQFIPVTVSTDRYMRAYSRWNATSWPSDNNKYWWMKGTSGTQFVNLMPNGYSAPTRLGYIGASDWVYGDFPGGAIQNNRWYCIELHLKKAGSSPYPVEMWIDGTRVINIANDMGYGNNPDGWGWEVNTNYAGTQAGFSCDHWMDGFVVSSTRVYPASLIEISNNSTYGSGTKNYQSPTYLSDTSCTITANLANLGGGPYYLWVTNNGQTRSDSYNLSGETDITAPTISEATPSTEQSCPASPTSLTIGVHTNETATCKYGTSDVAYASLPNTFTTTGGLIHSSNLSFNCDATYTYYVRCIDGSGNSNSASTPITFDVAAANPPPPPSAPTLSSPADAVTNQNFPIMLSWNAAATADSYTLQVSTVSNFATTVFDESLIITTSKSVPSLLNSTVYYWRVQATNEGGDSSWSSTRSFTTIAAGTRTVYWTESFETSSAGARGWENTTTWPITSSSCYSGNCLQIAFPASTATTPTGFATNTFKQIINGGTETLYVKFYQKFATNWVGSKLNYHPHLIFIPSNQDWDSNPYHGPALSYHELYIEPGNSTDGLSQTFIIQDGEQVNTAYSQLPNNLTAITETRDVGGCNGCLTGSTCGDGGICWDCGDGDWCNGRTWRNDSNKFTLNTWQKVEAYFRMNTITSGVANADGIMWMKVDDVTVLSYTNVVYRTGANPTLNWEQFTIGPYMERGTGSTGSQTMYIDELEVADYPEGSGVSIMPPSNIRLTIQNASGYKVRTGGGGVQLRLQ